MNNVYIGSRYVPLFDGAWDNTKSYEPLTIVSYGNNSYTSKRPVPVGIAPTNTNYWALTGNYNGEISQLEREILDETESRIREDAAIRLEMESIGTDRKKFFENKNIMIIGDSLCDPDTMAPNWVTLFKTEVEAYGATVNTDFCNDGDSFAGIGQRLVSFDTYSNDFDLIIIALGVNDYQGQYDVGFYNSTTVVIDNNYDSAAAENLLLQKLRTVFPKALQYYCPPHRTGRAIENIKYPITFYRNAFSRIAQYYGCRIIDWSSLPMFAPSAIGNSFNGYTSPNDVLHPTSAYAPILKEYMVQKLMSGGDNDWKDSWASIALPFNVSTGLSGNMIVNVSSHGEVRIGYAGNGNFTSEFATLVATFPLRLFPAIPQPVFIGNGWGRIEKYNDSLIIFQPSGQSTASALYIDARWLVENPMYYYNSITD